MGTIKDSVAWTAEWPDRFRSLQRAGPDEVNAFLTWWCHGLEDAFEARFEAFPPRPSPTS